MKKAFLTILILLIGLNAVCHAQGIRQRNIIYVLDCTGSMNGYNGAPDIWAPTKKFLKSELEKEARENPDAKITILPFQEKVLSPITVNPRDLKWSEYEATLDKYIGNLTATNICDSWLAAEKCIDRSCDNYIVLMTDGHDNIGGAANESARIEKLTEILKEFCGKYDNTKGMYVELTKSASLPDGIRNVIDICDNLYNIDASDGIPSFGCVADDRIVINTRDLPLDLDFGFSNSGKFKATVDDDDNEFVEVTIKNGYINRGVCTIHIESKFGDDIDRLNKAIGAKETDVDLTVESDDVIIINPEISLVLTTSEVRSLDLAADTLARIDRIKPFLWIKGNPVDTLRWNLSPRFSPQAITDGSIVKFGLKSTTPLDGCTLLFDNEQVGPDSIVWLTPTSAGVLELLVPSDVADRTFDLQLHEIGVKDIDRINSVRPGAGVVNLTGVCDTSLSWLEILVWILAALLILALLAWFAFIKKMKYPTFKAGMITVNDPYFANITAKGARKVIFTNNPAAKQGALNRLFTGRVLYHANPAWPCEAELTPSGRKNMRFRSSSGRLISDPSSIWVPHQDQTYRILDSQDNNKPVITLFV